MFSFLRTCHEKDINSVNLGKARKYNLARGDRELIFKGVLLSYYHAQGDCLEPAAQNQTHLDSIAIFKTQARYLIYYVLNYINSEHFTGKHVHVHATPDLEAARRFIEAMAYANKRSFHPAVIEDALAQDS